MSRYLSIARAAKPALTRLSPYEINEENEISPATSSTLAIDVEDVDEIDQKDEKSLATRTVAEATGAQLPYPELRCFGEPEEVAASQPPVGWDGSLPEGCAWQSLCEILGPCPRQPAGRMCRHDGKTP